MSNTENSTLRISHYESGVKTLGPGSRFVLWVQGCPFKCEGCISPEMRNKNGGRLINTSFLVEVILNEPNLEGITISGGEPMEQASALLQLVNQVRSFKDISVMCYTGHTFEFIKDKGNQFQNELLNNIDILIDGQYEQEKHTSLLWRGSSNQRIIALTPRHHQLLSSLSEKSDCSTGIEIRFDEKGTPLLIGVPPTAGFRDKFEEIIKKHGVILKTEDKVSE